MKLADLKRIPVGTVLYRTRSLLGISAPAEVTVHKVQSNAIQFLRADNPTRVSWLWFPKARQFRDDGDGFSILNDSGEIDVQYKFALPPEGK